MKIGFYGPDFVGDWSSGFCCMSYGFSNTSINSKECRYWQADLEAEAFCGSYDDAIAFAKSLGIVKAAIVITNNKGGENVFLKELSEVLGCPIVGGGAAIGNNPTVPSLSDMSAQAQLICLTDEQCKVDTVFENIHDQILGEFDLEFTDPRILDRINGEDAVTFLNRKKAELNLPESDFEHLTFSTLEHVNAHLNMNDGVHLASGRDLEHKMLLRYVHPERVQERMEHFYEDADAIIFGCAGLRGIMEHTHDASGFGGYFFGEICTVNGHSDFGNLMLSKIRISK